MNRYSLEEAVLNLVINARDAVEHAQGDTRRVVLRTRAVDSWVVLEVEDEGCGIPEDLQGRIFEPFFAKEPDKGTGLGLSISRAIVESFEGTLDIASQPAIETCAAIRLPTAAK
ncbi:MAG: ATP-binding protein [Candidatus Latescibacterota bacterium]